MARSPNNSNQLLELAVTNLGVIDQLGLVFGPGMTAITGETGAGKTLVLTALNLLKGERSDATVVGPHGDEAVVEGRFYFDGDELVLRRVVPRDGRSRAYVNGALATAGNLSDYGADLVEIHGQHGHTALTQTSAQRNALDAFGGINLEPLLAARQHRRDLLAQRDTLGGDQRERLRQIELYQFQVDEIEAANIVDADEDVRLREEEERLGDATGHQEAIAVVVEQLGSDGVADDAVGRALSAVEGRALLADLESQLRDLSALVTEVAAEARSVADGLEADPQRLDALQERRRALSELRRKYGDTLPDVLSFRDQCSSRLDELLDHDRLAGEIEELLSTAENEIQRLGKKVGKARRTAAPKLAEQVAAHLQQLALPNARLGVAVGDDPGDDVEMQVSMNTGAPLQPLAKIASGGELARTMLSMRLVLSAQPATMVFDEVDAGIGGAAAHSVGAALARLGRDRQVLVVTHLAQVAAFADNQITVVKSDDGALVTVNASQLSADERVVELSRMLSGSPDSDRARDHAAELLADAVAARSK